MNENIHEETFTAPPAREEGMPVDITQEEFVRFQMLFAKKFGQLKMQLPAIIIFSVYMLYFLTVMGQTWLESGQFPFAMVCISVLFAASMAVTMLMLPRRVRKTAESNYRLCDKNGYYGEWTINADAICKETGEATETLPLSERTVYIETADGMAFLSAMGEHKTIFLPARCMTEDAAKKVREIVFDPACRVQRRVIARMTAKASEPMPRRPLLEEPATLYTVDVTYEDAELKKMCNDRAWRQFGKGMLLFLPVSLFLGAAIAMGFENVAAGLLTVPVLILLYLLLMIARASRDAKAIRRAGRQRLILTVNEQYITFRQPPVAPVSVMWKYVDRAVETPDSVELFYGGNFMWLPKRAVEDMDELRRIVDACMKK